MKILQQFLKNSLGSMSVRGISVIFSVLAISDQVKLSPRVDPLVKTNVGLIRGLKATDGDYSMFLGIPYGKVQEDNLFAPSSPYPPFEDVFFAQDDTSICPQIEDLNNEIVGNIDCLHLNVYSPDRASSSNKIPVMVFIHGGGYAHGDKLMRNYGPKFLVKHDVILVVMNYRLGVYGFMCLDDPKVPGNQGLKDQLLALRWIKDNIEAFGGDVNKITISGESAGADAVLLHTLANTETLFHRVIVQSGTSLAPWSMQEPDRNAPFKLADGLGFEGGNIEEALRYLSSFNTDAVVAKAEEISIRFSPCVEKKYENVEIFIESDPLNNKGEKAKNIPILIGVNEDELIYRYRGIDMKDVGDLFRQTLRENFNFDENKLNTLADIVRKFYIGDEIITDELRTDIIDFDSDFHVKHPAQRIIKTYTENGRTVFYYMFSYVGKRNFLRKKFGLTGGGASHADELGYLFEIDILPEPDEADQLMIDRMTTLWTNFIKFGDPTPENSEFLPKWTPVVEGRLDYLSLDYEVQMKSRPSKEHMAFWDLFYDTYANLQKTYDDNA